MKIRRDVFVRASAQRAFKKGSLLTTLALATVLAWSLSYAQQPQPQAPQSQPQQPTTTPSGQNGQKGQPANPQLPTRTTNLERAQAAFAKLQPQKAVTPLTIGNITVPPTSVGDTVTFTVHVYDQTAANGVYQYALQGNPYGSYVDPNTGAFTWVPLTPGMYSFYVWVEDVNDPARQGFEQVTITVNPALQPFGYSLFAKARAVIDTRMLLLKSGLLQGLNTVNGNLSTIPISPTPTNNQPNVFVPGTNVPNIFNATSPLFGGANQNQQFTPQGTSSLVPGPFQPPISPWGSIQNLGPQTNLQPQQTQPQFGPSSQSGSVPLPQSIPGIGNVPGQTGYPTYPSYNQSGNLNGPIPQYGSQGSMGGAMGGYSGMGGYGAMQQLQQMAQGQLGSQTGIPPASPFGLNIQPQQPGQGGFNLATPNFQSFNPQAYGNGYSTLLNNSQPFTSTGPSGLSIVPNNAFANFQYGTYSAPQASGLPGLNPGLTADALKYLVGPLEDMGMNVYLPYPERYQLGPGDLLTAKIGSTTLPEQTFDLKVDDQGRVLLPTDTQEIIIRGRTLAQAQTLLEQRVQKLFKGGQLTLTLKALRTMSIQILGDAYMPGSYQVPAVATLFNTLILCGGPDDNGSLRRIQLKRNDGTTETFDLYDYLTKGDTKADVPLQPGDVIFIPPVGPRLNIRGEVERPAIYEVLPSDTITRLVTYAGGVTAAGVAQRAELDTEAPGIGHEVRDVDLHSDTPEKIYNNDTLSVFPIPKDILDDIVLDGAVQQPGTYEFRNGITIGDVIMKAGGLRPDAYTVRADLFRRNPDKTETEIPIDLEAALKRNPSANVPLAPHDRIEVYHISDVKWKGDRIVTVLGSVQKPGTYDRYDNEHVLDLLLQAGGVTGDAYKDVAILQRTNPDHTSGPLIRLDLNKLAVDPAENVLLDNLDTLTIQSQERANFTPDQTVGILGAVQKPDTYQYATNMHLRDLLQEAGNPMPNAGPVLQLQHARVPISTPPITISMKDLMSGDPSANMLLQPGDVVTLPEDSHILLHPRQIMVLGRVENPGPYVIGEYETLSDAIARAGGLLKDAFIQGTQFYRDPKLLTTDSQAVLTQDVVKMIQFVAQDEFNRALASADVQKVRLLQSNTTTTSLPLVPGSTAAQTNSTGNVPPLIWNEPLVTPARDITQLLQPTGSLNIDLSAALAHHRSARDLELEDGDIVIVPKRPSTVAIVGAVTVSSAVGYTPGKTVAWYVNRAGGFTLDAAKDRVIIIKAGGLVQKATLHTRVDLGDQIIVPTQVMAARLSDKAEEIDQVSKQVTAGAVVLAVLAALFHL